MNEKWICPTCGAECDGNFCIRCGSKRPEESRTEAEPEKRIEDPTWRCSCGAENRGNFCTNCGNKRPEAREAPQMAVSEVQAAPPQMTAAMPQAPVPQMTAPGLQAAMPQAPVKKKSRALLWILIGAGAAVIIAAAVLLYFFVFRKDYVVNRYEAGAPLEVDAGLDLLTDSEQDLAVLYPHELDAAIMDNGAYIYGGAEHENCYVQIRRMAGKESPERYFKTYEKEMQEMYGELKFSGICESEVEGKTLYMVFAYIPELEGDQMQFLELYPDFYITYTSCGYPSEAPNTELYYAVKTLKPSAEAYEIPPEAEVQLHENEMGNFQVGILDDYEITEFKSGLYAEKDEVLLFAAYFNSDPLGCAIYDRADFIDRTTQVDNYVAKILGVQSVSFEKGTEETINGESFLCYPMTAIMEDNTEESGIFCIADAEDLGCYFICYYLPENAKSSLQEEAEAFRKSVIIQGAPNISDYTIFDASDHGLGKIAVKSELSGGIEVQDLSLAIESPADKKYVVMDVLKGPEVLDAAKKQVEEISKRAEKEPEIKEAEIPEEGRYFFDAYQVNYSEKGVAHTYKIVGVTDTEGNVYCVHYDLADADLAWAEEVLENVIWSWKLD